jgi:quercetin dioxygenase-like cupin family protein
MADDQAAEANPVAREHLLTGAVSGPIDRIEAHRVVLRPGQSAGRHAHVGGVVGCVLEGEIAFEEDGQPVKRLKAGSVFFEPPGAMILRFDNLSTKAPAVFVAFYPLLGDQPLISR